MEIFRLFGSVFVDSSKAEDSIAKTDKKAGGLGSTLVGAAKTAGKFAAGLAGAAAAGVTAMVAVAEKTREYRTEMGKLDTAFTTAGHSSSAAKETYSALQSILGETDVAVEASNHLAKLCTSEKDLQKWTDICTGVYATFGDSLPVEGLTEAANETAKVGQVTGPLADALNWAGVSEDAFNASLAKCSSEQERQALITETLNGLYDEASTTYKQNNADIINANASQEKLTSAMANFGAVIEPVLNTAKVMFADLLVMLVPAIENLANVLFPLLNTAFNFLFTSIQEVWASIGQPLMDFIIGAFSRVGTSGGGAFSGIQVVFLNLMTAMQTLWTTIGVPLFNVIKQVVKLVADFFKQNFDAIKTHVKTCFDIIKTIYNTIFKPVFDIIISLVTKVMGVFKEYMPAISGLFKSVVNTISDNWNKNLKPVFEKIGSFIQNTLKPIFDKVFTYGIVPIIKGAFATIGKLWNNSLKPIFDGICTFLNGVFSGNWKKIFGGLKDIVSGAFNGLLDILKAPFRAIANIWNATLGKIHFEIPSWIPGIGGKGFGFPTIPAFAEGTDWFEGGAALVGEKGPEIVDLPRGSRVTPNNELDDFGDGSRLLDLLSKIIQLLELYLPGFKFPDIYLDGRIVAKQVTPYVDAELEGIRLMKGRAN